MSGAERTDSQIAEDVFHALHPECPAFPGVPNACSPQICDCFNCEQLPEKAAALVAGLWEIARLTQARYEGEDPQRMLIHRVAGVALGHLADVKIEDIIGGGEC